LRAFEENLSRIFAATVTKRIEDTADKAIRDESTGGAI
jgi:hypothetical protein